MRGYKLTKKQNEYIVNANARWNLKIGAVRSGKSFVDIAHVIPERLIELSGEQGLNLFMGVSKETIERNVLQPMRELYTDDLVGSINNRNIAMVCGVPVYCLGAEKITQVAKIQGMSVKYCYGDEIAKWNPDVFRMLQSRLDKPYSCFDGACNPESPNHWLKTFIDNPEIDSYIQKYQIFDNSFLPKDFIDNLCKEYAGTVYYDRYILGEWALAEGLIYPMYQNAITDGLPVGNDGVIPASDYVISIDYGTMNAFAAMLWSKRGGIWYGEREYYYSGRDTGTQKTDDEYARDLDEWIADTWEEYQHMPVKGGIFATERGKIRTIIDPSAASFIALLRKKEWCKVTKADNNVADGIRETAVALQLGLVKLLKTSVPNLIRELGGYVWDMDSPDEKPIKVDDHGCDAMRYFCHTMKLVQRAHERKL